MKKSIWAKVSVAMAVMSWGTLSLFIKKINLAPSELSLIRAALAFLILSLFRLFSPTKTKPTKKQIPLLLLSGALIGFDWIGLFTAYQYTSVALSTLAYYFSPTLIVLGSRLFYHEKTTKFGLFCFLASTASLVCVIGASGGGSNDLLGLGFGLIAAAIYALIILLNKKITGLDGLTQTRMQLFATIVVLTPYVGLTEGFHITALSWGDWSNLLIISVVHTGIMYVLYFNALRQLKGQEIAVLSYLDPATAVFISLFVLEETITPLQLIGGVGIIAFALLNEIRPKQKLNP